jgi:hypothetical protein
MEEVTVEVVHGPNRESHTFSYNRKSINGEWLSDESIMDMAETSAYNTFGPRPDIHSVSIVE